MITLMFDKKCGNKVQQVDQKKVGQIASCNQWPSLFKQWI
jgi:hypothetical protein